MKNNKKECVYGGYESPEIYDHYERIIDIKHWVSCHKSLMCSLSVIAAALVSILLFFLTM